MLHGGNLDEAIRHYGGTRQSWLDLSTGINPSPWPFDPSLLSPASLNALPDQAAYENLLAAARKYYRVPEKLGICAAPGTQALIQWLPFLYPQKNVAIVGPTYNEHAACWARTAKSIHEIAHPDDPVETDVLIVCNPENPTGRTFDPRRLIETAAENNARLLVIDEAFADTEPEISAIPHAENAECIILRSFGKFFGLAGLRLGFAISQSETVKRISDVLGPWSVSAPALSLGASALADTAWHARTLHSLSSSRDRLLSVLNASEIKVEGSTLLFVLVRVDDAAYFQDMLARNEIWCRIFPGRKGLVRLGIPADDAGLTRLAAALKGL